MFFSKSDWRSIRLITLSMSSMFYSHREFIIKPVNFFKDIKKDPQHFICEYHGYIMAIVITLSALYKFQEFGGLKFEQYLFFIIIPFTLKKGRNELYFNGIISLSIILLVVFYLTHTYSILYFSVCLAIMASLALTQYRAGILTILLAIITTPAVKFLLSSFSFPIRLKLTEAAGYLLSLFINDLSISGNCILINQQEFTVAHECLGLNMISVSLAFCIFCLGFWSIKTKKKPGLHHIAFLVIITSTLIIIANFMRIITTIILQSPPKTIGHELIGILTLLAYCIIPAFAISRLLKKHFYTEKNRSFKKKQLHYLSLLIPPLLVLGSYGIHNNSIKPQFSPMSVKLEGYHKTISKDGVIKLENQESLIYVKPPAFILGSDHNPFICWKASGYVIKNEKEIVINKQKVYYFELYKENQPPLYSCWYYSNGMQNTNSQLSWRISTLKGDKPYSVVNITSNNKHQTRKITKEILQTKNLIQNTKK